MNFSPNYSYRTLNNSDEFGYIGGLDVAIREGLDDPSFGFNTGIAAQYSILENLEVELGVQFSRQTHIFKDVSLIDFDSYDNIGKADNQFRYHYLEIPLRLNYRVINKKVFAYITAGVSLNQYLYSESKSWITYNNGDEKVVISDLEIIDYNKMVFGLIGGVGVGYHLSERFNIRAEPLYRYSITPLADAPIEQRNYSIGCQFGIYISL